MRDIEQIQQVLGMPFPTNSDELTSKCNQYSFCLKCCTRDELKPDENSNTECFMENLLKGYNGEKCTMIDCLGEYILRPAMVPHSAEKTEFGWMGLEIIM